MKKLIAFIGLFAMVLVALPCNIVNASVGDLYAKKSYQTVEEFEQYRSFYEVDWIKGMTLYTLSDYPYWCYQSYYAETEQQYRMDILYSKYPLAYCTDYLTEGVKGTLHPYNCTDDGASYVHLKESDSFAVRFTPHGGSGNGTFSKSYIDHDTVSEAYLYANHDIVRYGTDDVVFQANAVSFQLAPVRTELAVILEQSNRLITPTTQVISLLPLAISLVVSFLALRKFLQVLRTILSGA